MPFTLLRPHFLTIRNRFRFGARTTYGRRRDQMLLAIVLLIMLCIFAAVLMGLRTLSSTEAFLHLVPTKMIELAALGFLLLLVVSNAVAAIGNIYTSEHLNLILPTPTSPIRLYNAKFVETFLETSIMFYVFTLPAIAAIIVAGLAGWLFIPYFILVTVPFLLIPTAMGIFLSAFFVNAFTLLWRRGQLFVLAILISIGWAFHKIWAEIEVVRANRSGSEVILKAISIYQNPNPYWSPSRWVSDLLTAGLTGNYRFWSLNFLLLCLTPLALGALGFLVFDLLMLRIRSAGQSNSLRRIRHSGSAISFGKLFETTATLCGTDQQVRAIVAKDYSALLRDRSQALQLLMYLFLATTYVTLFNFMGSAFGMAGGMQQAWSAMLTSLNVVFAGFIISTLMTRLVYPSVSLEGRSFWVLQVTPLEIERLMRAKFYCWLPITALLSIGLLVAGSLAVGMQAYQIPFVIIVGASLSIACTGLAVGFGAKYANFHWEAPNQITVGLGTMILLLSNVTWILIQSIPAAIVTCFIVIPNLRIVLGPGRSFLIMASGTFIIVFSSLLMARWAVKSGAQALEAQRIAT